MKIQVLLVILLGAMTLPVAAQSQTPEILSVSSVVAGAQRTETLWAHAVGKWSDASNDLAVYSTEIECYKSFGFCAEADAQYAFGRAGATLNTFDILRWNDRELIAVDSSPICVVNTLRFDFVTKKVSVTMGLKGETKDPFCKNIEATTAFLGGVRDEIRKPQRKSGQGDK